MAHNSGEDKTQPSVTDQIFRELAELQQKQTADERDLRLQLEVAKVYDDKHNSKALSESKRSPYPETLPSYKENMVWLKSDIRLFTELVTAIEPIINQAKNQMDSASEDAQLWRTALTKFDERGADEVNDPSSQAVQKFDEEVDKYMERSKKMQSIRSAINTLQTLVSFDRMNSVKKFKHENDFYLSTKVEKPDVH